MLTTMPSVAGNLIKRFADGGELSRPSGLCFASDGDLLVTDMSGRVLRVRDPRARSTAGDGHPPGTVTVVFADLTAREHGRRLSPSPRNLPPKPLDVRCARGLVFVTSHTGRDGEDNHGKLSVWDERTGQLLAVHSLAPYLHPNGMAVFEL